MNELNNNNNKQHCVVCDCMVVVDGHKDRCRPKREKGWSESRVSAWFGDTVHRLDVQLAVSKMGCSKVAWESGAQIYTSNASMAKYMRALQPAIEGSDHTVATAFEARYSGDFRYKYLEAMFPVVFLEVFYAWTPPKFE